ncbi:hypothetical protein EJ08DRAFT_692336 [Tothia fuscella]|uniref:Transcription initiation factor TFIID subunit 2 n=1 Tax=Tothia fuscella TaxID=1048955 RepID=A0A9P4P059_9PEZI|nr:hypothetical protein EJ08DRAFT_692336 [Tothia fuscella]
MPGLIEMEPPQVPAQKESGFNVIHQDVKLNIDFETCKITGSTELTLDPQSRDLRVVKLCCRGIKVRNILVNGKFPVAPANVNYRDPYDGLRVRDNYGVEQHHILRENIEDAIKEPPEPTLIITLPKQARVQAAAEGLDFPLGRSQVGSARANGAAETPAPRTAEDAEGMFDSITISMDFTLEDTRHVMQWVGLRKGDTRYPHAYTTASSVPGSFPSFAFPCVGTPSSRCSWRLTIRCPRTLGDIGKEPAKAITQMNGAGSQDFPLASTNGNAGGDTHMSDADASHGDDFFGSMLSEEEKERDFVVVCSGFMEDSDAPLENQSPMREWVFYCELPVPAHHVGFTIGPFERVNLTEFRENQRDEQGKFQPVNVYGFCLPGRVPELRNIGMPLSMAMDYICEEYTPYPFPSASLSHKMCFVDDLAADVIDTATLSICSSRHLIPETITDKTYESSRVLIRAIASQWVGVRITPKDPRDYWIIVGGSLFMADMFMQKLWGKNTLRHRQYQAMRRVAELDVDRPTLYELGGALGVDRSELQFLTLKAPLVFFILHQRMLKKTGLNGVPRLLERVFQDADAGRVVDGEIDTDRFIYSCDKVAHGKMRSFFDQWVTNAGCPTFVVNAKFNKKKMQVDLEIKQETVSLEALTTGGQKLNTGNFMREAKEHEGEVYAGPPQHYFTGPITLRIHEADGTPYEHTAEIEKPFTQLAIPYNTKYKRLKRSKLQKEREAAAEGVNVAEDGDGDVLTYCLGDGLQSEEQIKEWRLSDWTKAEEQVMSNDSYEWLRFDKDFEWICNVRLESPIHMWVSQLQQDNDVVAQMQAIEWLQSNQPRALTSTVLTRTVMDERYFYGVRVAAVNALTQCATPQLNYIGQFHLLKLFQHFFCFENSSMTRSNDFSDQRSYYIQCEIPKALSRIRDHHGKAPDEIKRFFLDRLKFNDNSSNEYSDNYYVATLLNCLAESMMEPPVSMSFSFNDLTEEAAEIDFKRDALNEIERHRRIDEWIPSYRNLYTRAALQCQKRLIESKAAPRRLADFMQYLRPGNLDEVRLAALDAIVELGALKDSAVLRCVLYLFSTEPSPYLRDHFWVLIERGFGLITFADEPLPTQASSGGFVIAESESADVRREQAARAESIEGAIKFLRRRLGENKVLQEALMDALRSPIIGIKDFLEILGVCSMLYTPGRGVVAVLKYPRYYNVEHIGTAKLRFFKTSRWRTTKIPPLNVKDLKNSKRARLGSDNRSVSPEAKRRRTSITLTNKNAPHVILPSVEVPGQTPQSSLPSPTASQPTSFTSIPNAMPSPRVPTPQQATMRGVTPKVTKSRSSTPKITKSRSSTPKIGRAPTPKVSTIKVAPPKFSLVKFGTGKSTTSKTKPTETSKMVVLKISDKAKFAARVASFSEASQLAASEIAVPVVDSAPVAAAPLPPSHALPPIPPPVIMSETPLADASKPTPTSKIRLTFKVNK